MAITVPVPGSVIATAAFGIPVANALNALGASTVVTIPTTTGAIATTSANLVVATATLPAIPQRSLIIAKQTMLASSLSLGSYVQMSIGITGAPGRVIRHSATAVAGNHTVQCFNFAVVAANTEIVVTGNLSSQASGTFTTAGSTDYNTLQVVRIPLPDA